MGTDVFAKGEVSLNSTDPVLLVGDRYRMFTPREVARIQSFPDSFKLDVPKSAAYYGLGNAVPPVLMWHVTQAVISALQNNQ
jgi:DNA (cytosine-5)-methyltransferase 1